MGVPERLRSAVAAVDRELGLTAMELESPDGDRWSYSRGDCPQCGRGSCERRSRNVAHSPWATSAQKGSGLWETVWKWSDCRRPGCWAESFLAGLAVIRFFANLHDKPWPDPGFRTEG